jgi:hypothetical protein
MGDLLFVAITVGFFALCILYVRACDHVIGPDPELDVAEGPGRVASTDTDPVPADDETATVPAR